MFRIDRVAAVLREMGHALEWDLVGPVVNNRPGDPGWVARLDGEVIVEGGAIGLLEQDLARVPLMPLEWHAVSKLVNSPRNDVPECIAAA